MHVVLEVHALTTCWLQTSKNVEVADHDVELGASDLKKVAACAVHEGPELSGCAWGP